MIIGSICSYYYSDYKRKQDYKDYKVFLKKTFNGKSKLVDKLSKKVTSEESGESLFSNKRVDENNEEVNQTFYLKKGGWSIFVLKADYSNEFEYIENESMDMSFKVPEKRLEKYRRYSTILGEEIDDYKYVSTNRGTVQEVYNSKLEYLINKFGKENYIPDSYEKMRRFFNKISDFYFLELSEKTKSIDSYKYQSSVFNSKSILWYKTSTETWRINLNKDEYNYFLGKNLIIGNIIAILLFLFWKYGRRIEFNR
jgi:hypothetical protein